MLTDGRTATRMLDTHECARCGGRLIDAWDSAANSYNVRCGSCENQTEFKRCKTLRQLYREGASLPIAIVNRFQKADRAEVEDVAAGLPAELATIVRERMLGTTGPKEGEKK